MDAADAAAQVSAAADRRAAGDTSASEAGLAEAAAAHAGELAAAADAQAALRTEHAAALEALRERLGEDVRAAGQEREAAKLECHAAAAGLERAETALEAARADATVKRERARKLLAEREAEIEQLKQAAAAAPALASAAAPALDRVLDEADVSALAFAADVAAAVGGDGGAYGDNDEAEAAPESGGAAEPSAADIEAADFSEQQIFQLARMQAEGSQRSQEERERLRAHAEALQVQLERKDAQLQELDDRNADLEEKVDSVRSAEKRTSDLEGAGAAQDKLTYLKNAVLSLLRLPEDSPVRAADERVIATILRFTDRERAELSAARTAAAQEAPAVSVNWRQLGGLIGIGGRALLTSAPGEGAAAAGDVAAPPPGA